jgi:hypothetical protein
MAKLNLELSSKTATGEEVKVEEQKTVPFKNRVPLRWAIQVLDKDRISAHNNVSMENFEGTLKEFNAKMRG